MNDLEDLIRRRAYELWEQSGKTGGSASPTDFWLQAEREVKQDRDGSASPAAKDSLEQRLD